MPIEFLTVGFKHSTLYLLSFLRQIQFLESLLKSSNLDSSLQIIFSHSPFHVFRILHHPNFFFRFFSEIKGFFFAACPLYPSSCKVLCTVLEEIVISIAVLKFSVISSKVLFLFSLVRFINFLLSHSDNILGLPERNSVLVEPCS